MLYAVFDMKNIQPTYIHYSFGVQEFLPLDVPVRISSDDPVYSFLDVIKRINLVRIIPLLMTVSCCSELSFLRSWFPKRVFLFVISNSRTDVRFLFLSDYSSPSHQAFKRVLDQLQNGAIDQFFFELSHHIAYNLMCIDPDVQYVDGTKIEANAHKNSFVYKKRILHARQHMYLRITDLLFESISRMDIIIRSRTAMNRRICFMWFNI